MKQKFYPILSITVLFILGFQFSLFSQPFSLLKDINPGSNGSSYFNFTNVNGVLFFRPDDGVHGDELWKTNGTPAGTTIVKDIYPGIQGSDLQSFTSSNSVLYFRADDGVHGAELWKSDGTETGTVMIKDISPGVNSSFYSALKNINGTIYFQANDGINGYELWKSDGTEGGTVMVKDIFPGISTTGQMAGTPNSGNPQNFTSVNNTVFFSAADAYDKNELWKTDGTTGGTVLIKDIYPGLTYSLNNFINLSGTLYFTVDGGGNGSELWKSDGTTAGTIMVKSFFGGNFDTHCTVLDEAIYFLETDGLWKSDGTPSGTFLLKERNDAHSGAPELLVTVNGALYFTGYDDVHGQELWKSDGTPAGTVLVKDINPGNNNSEINSFARIGNKLMFSAENGVHGSEIWVSDGTEAGTKLVQDIEPGNGSSMPVQFFELKETIIEVKGKVFAGVTTSDLGMEVWVGNIPADIGLPLELLEFEGILLNNDGLLDWKTENETNTATFIVERSLDGRSYQPVGSVLAANSIGLHSYSFTDPNIVSLETAVAYYRLKQVDTDGNYTYSEIVALAMDKKKGSINLFPNPIISEMNLRIYTPRNEKLQWQLVDNNGRLIRYGQYEIVAGVTNLSEDIGRLSAGVYFMKISGQTLQKVIKVIKK
jgi:ELWxxDGT repeat protein